MPFTAVEQRLPRLSSLGVIQRFGKGLYYQPRQTTSEKEFFLLIVAQLTYSVLARRMQQG